jgi:hypothetical protein
VESLLLAFHRSVIFTALFAVSSADLWPQIVTHALRLACGPGHRMLKWFNAAFQFGIGIVHFFVALRNARYNNFRAASSFGNEPRILMILRSDMFSDSTAFVV